MSEKVALSLAYQAGCRIAIGCCSSKCFAASVTIEYKARIVGVVGDGRGPLPLGLHAQMGACFFETHFALPTADEPCQNLFGSAASSVTVLSVTKFTRHLPDSERFSGREGIRT